jgi:hypothetical protein
MIRYGMKVSVDHFYPIRARFFPIGDHLKGTYGTLLPDSVLTPGEPSPAAARLRVLLCRRRVANYTYDDSWCAASAA